MKNILHICSDIRARSAYYALAERTEGMVHNIGVLYGVEAMEGAASTMVQHVTHGGDRLSSSSELMRAVQRIKALAIQQIETGQETFMHAHSLFPCGLVAEQIFLERRINYLVTITQEDLIYLSDNPRNFKKMGLPALTHANRIVFLDDNFQFALAKHLSDQSADAVFSRAITIHDGLNPYWFEHLRQPKPVSLIHIRLLFGGVFLQRRALDPLLKAIDLIRKEHFDVVMTVVGLPLKQQKQHEAVTYVSLPDGNEALMNLVRQHDLYVSPSHMDVSQNLFREALTQGLPILHAAHEGLVGICPDALAGYITDLHNANDLVDKILMVSHRYATIEQHIADLYPFSSYNWNDIYRKYLRIYKR